MSIKGTFLFLLLAVSAFATDYKTGIDTTFSGTSGTDYQEEFFFSDPLITDRKVVYIKAATSITLTHNSRNVSYNGNGTYTAVSGTNYGTIRYKIDRDLQWGRHWGDAGSSTNFVKFNGTTEAVSETNNTAYSAPFTLASLTYDGSTAVVGTTGATGTAGTWGSYYWRGIVDPFGDEWHVLTVADDDSAFISDTEGTASDGKIILLVVNPKTPCLTITTTGNAQFYTTPPKVYFVPKVHAQTTYFSAGTGTISFSLRDINGNTVYYRINGGSWLSATNPVLTASDFITGTNTLEYYYTGNAAYTKTRTIVKDPAFPSAGETHGDLLWGTGGWSAVQTRLARSPYYSVFSQYFGNDSTANKLTAFEADYHTGNRHLYSVFAWRNALAAKYRGWTTNATGKSQSSALYAKQMLMDNDRTIDPVGFEINHNGRGIPARELFYRGYYDMKATFSLAYAYDLLIANFKSTQYTGGITAVEDYYLRDCLAQCAMDAMMTEGNYTMQVYGPTAGHMWGTARNVGGLVVALAMPNYSTPYYGTSGFDGNTTVYAYTPFPNTPLTWKKVFSDNDATLVGYPDLHYRFGVEELELTSDSKFCDKVGYFANTLMGDIFAQAINMAGLHTGKSYPRAQQAFLNNANGTLLGTVATDNYATFGYATPYGPYQCSQVSAYNARFPSSAVIGLAYATAQGTSDNGFNHSLYANPFGLVFMDDTYTGTTNTATIGTLNVGTINFQ